MRTTLNINDALLKELRDRAARTGQSFRNVVEETIASGLARQVRAESRRKYKVRPHALNLKPGFRNVSLNQVYDQLEAEDVAE